MIQPITHYGMRTEVQLPFATAVERTREALADEGFGVLCEIDVAATMKKKLDVDFPPYVILGACNPPLALQALRAEQDIGLLLPCNVVVYSEGKAGSSVVAAIDPEEALSLTANAAMRPLAADVRVRLERVLSAVAQSEVELA